MSIGQLYLDLCNDPTASRTCLRNITIDHLFTLSRLVGALKHDILLPQPQNETNLDVAPQFIGPSVGGFLAAAMGLDLEMMNLLWKISKDYIWNIQPAPRLQPEDYELFAKFGWNVGLMAVSMWPQSLYCTNPACTNRNALKKESQQKCVVYTRGKGAQPAKNVHLYCQACNTSYHNNFTVFNATRTYQNIPDYIEVGEHQFVEVGLARMWRASMLLGWMSGSNSARLYEHSFANDAIFPEDNPDWTLGRKLTSDHVWDAFIILSLLEDCERVGTYLRVPHSGKQNERFNDAMQKRNDDFIKFGQPGVVRHECDKCMRVYKDPVTGKTRKIRAIVGDGISMGRPCCGEFRCDIPLANNRHRFCPKHFDLHNRCAVADCKAPVRTERAVKQGKEVKKKKKTCDDPLHQAVEAKNAARSTGSFLYAARFKHATVAFPTDAMPDLEDATRDFGAENGGAGASEASEGHEDDGDLDVPEVQEDFESYLITQDDDGNTKLVMVVQEKVGSVGTADDEAEPGPSKLPAEVAVNVDSNKGKGKGKGKKKKGKKGGRSKSPDECPSKSPQGNRVLKAQLNRRRTHNEQTIIRPCGLTYARATFLGAEAVSNYLRMVKAAFSVPGAVKPEHSFYDTNCDARQQARKDPWFNEMEMCVDVWHFENKHAKDHEYCQLNCNPAKFPELMNDDGSWYFNTSIAEQTNAWLGGYHSIVREMLKVKYDFFLDEMIRLRNIEVLERLERAGHNPRVIED